MTSRVDYRALLAQVHGTRYYFVPNVLRDGVAVSRLDAAQARWLPGSGLTEMVAEPGAPSIVDVDWMTSTSSPFDMYINEIPEEGLNFSDTTQALIEVINEGDKTISVQVQIPPGSLPSDVVGGEDCVSHVTTTGLSETRSIPPAGAETFLLPISGTLFVPQNSTNYTDPPTAISVGFPSGVVVVNGTYPIEDLYVDWPSPDGW